MRLGRRRFVDVIERQLDLFSADEAELLDEAAASDAAWTSAPREESEERYGDYQLVVDAVADRLAEIRDHYASALDESTGRDISCSLQPRGDEALRALRVGARRLR